MSLPNKTYKEIRKKIDRKFKYRNLFRREIKYPDKKFVIYTRGRTGSTLLSELLNCHPEIFCDVEIFNLIYSGTKVKFPIPYINSCSKRATLHGKSAYGFKVKISQMRIEHDYDNYVKILNDLNDAGWKFIYLKRLNHLRHKISNFLTTQTNVFHVRNDESYDHKLKVDCKELMRGIIYSEEVEVNERESLKNIPHLELIYEKDLLEENVHQKTADKVFDYLDLKRFEVKSGYKRIIPEKLKDIVINYDEVYNYFKDTKYAGFLNEQ